MNLSFIFFDLDNTLLDRDAAWRIYWSQFIQQNPAIFNPHSQSALEQIIIEDQHGWRDRAAFFSWLTQSFPKLDQPPMALWEQCRQQLGKLSVPYPGVRELLICLKKTYPLTLVSNGSSTVQRMKLLHSGLAVFFDHIFISGEVGVDKPDPGIFKAALKESNYAPENILFVGDDPVRDVFGAGSLGLQTCWISHGNSWTANQSKPDFILREVTELPALLQRNSSNHIKLCRT
ncbi:HAD family hydrolase [Pedosphaera parvula]|uniref:HAD-superfamily hydrolase, subfamily IA, variant 1 n=1 Tax=Pedosphaera parvula (strain Ellin514) TaxID=320771 RepID=B9XL18_PEDPL|nr:HAD family hydrolase [Pedosphaera parvula]EEF59512.1 HAD-superfamily hydrolase, subfamily IA, variant 1 [Pedosphaera parvula Ellin514]